MRWSHLKADTVCSSNRTNANGKIFVSWRKNSRVTCICDANGENFLATINFSNHLHKASLGYNSAITWHVGNCQTHTNTVNIVNKLVTVFAGYQPLTSCILTIYRDTSVAQLCISWQLTRQNVISCVPRHSSCSKGYRDGKNCAIPGSLPGQFRS